jgi:membrane-bound ClpP family serine protease
MSEKNKRTIFVVVLQLAVATLFIASPSWMSRSMRVIYQSYFADVVIPFSFYFLLSLMSDNFKQLKKWWVKALLVFGLCALSETLQYFGVFALARVFDPLDYLMYGVGVLLAAFVDRQIFARMLPFWE